MKFKLKYSFVLFVLCTLGTSCSNDDVFLEKKNESSVNMSSRFQDGVELKKMGFSILILPKLLTERLQKSID